jgi:putative sigma-54 modulation protein
MMFSVFLVEREMERWRRKKVARRLPQQAASVKARKRERSDFFRGRGAGGGTGVSPVKSGAGQFRSCSASGRGQSALVLDVVFFDSRTRTPDGKTPRQGNTQRNKKTAMPNSDTIRISGLNLELTEPLKEHVKGKLAKVLKHNERIIRINVELEYRPSRKHVKEYVAKAQVELRGPSIIVSVESDDLYKSIDALGEKLTRQVRRRHRLVKEKRNHPHDVELPVELPKAATAKPKAKAKAKARVKVNIDVDAAEGEEEAA